jgi:sugar phosphate isomerase/epimerase
MHIKDGLFPTEGNHLGKEVPVGEGKVDFPQLIQKLRRDGYVGFITIEREIKDGQHAEGIAKTRDFLRSL